jgi:hypothetical protein
MPPVVEFRIVLLVFIIWAVVSVIVAIRRTSPQWLNWLLVLPLILFLRRNPFGSDLSAMIFMVLVSALALLMGLSFPLTWWLKGALGPVSAVFSAVLLTVPSLLKGAVPRRRWVGVMLAALFGPWGHWYLEDGGRWVAAMWALSLVTGLVIQLVASGRPMVSGAKLPEFPTLWLGWPGVLLHVLSGCLMYLRFTYQAPVGKDQAQSA